MLVAAGFVDVKIAVKENGRDIVKGWIAGSGLGETAFLMFFFAGFALVAAAVFGLAMVYRSQAVGVLGVLGAFITPLLIGAEFDSGIFPLVYVAVINAPVILLGMKRDWQILYNLSFYLNRIANMSS